VRSLACWMVVVVYRNDMPIETWSIATSKCVTFLIITLYVNSWNCLTNSFVVLLIYLDFLAALFPIASTATMSSSLLSLSSYLSLRKKILPMIVSTMSAEMTNSIESTFRSMCWCKVLMRFTLLLKYSFLSWLDSA
jgi:hypothetical protein